MPLIMFRIATLKPLQGQRLPSHCFSDHHSLILASLTQHAAHPGERHNCWIGHTGVRDGSKTCPGRSLCRALDVCIGLLCRALEVSQTENSDWYLMQCKARALQTATTFWGHLETFSMKQMASGRAPYRFVLLATLCHGEHESHVELSIQVLPKWAPWKLKT